MRRAGRKDEHHAATVDYLRRHGFDVVDFGSVGTVPDLLVTKAGIVSFIELKVPGSGAKWYARQLRWIADTKFNVAVAKSPEDALAAVRDRRFLSQRTKDGIAALLAVQYRESYTPKQIEALMG